MRIKAILFDLDGTLLDRDASLKRFIESQHSRLHPVLGHIPLEDYQTRFVELDARGYVWKDRVYQQLMEEFDIRGISQQELLADYVSQFHHSCEPFPHLIELFERLRSLGIRLGMITNGFTALQLSNIRALDIESYFATILVSEQEGLRKPDSAIFRRALERLGVSPEESMYVGDHPVNDIQASQQVGMIGVWKQDPYWEADVHADYMIDDLLELEQVLQQR